jgi:predicted ferric reductase
MESAKAILIWCGLALVVVLPVAVAANSPLLQWREPIYILAGLAGIVAMATMLCQPLLVGGRLPGLARRKGRQAHGAVGIILILMVVFHVAGLWVTSPPDMLDALTFSAPTAFSTLGVISMWMLFAAASFALVRSNIRARFWRMGHAICVSLSVLTAVAHAILIEGTMGIWSKTVLCLLVVAATAKVMADIRIWRSFRGGRT